jgi:hypothetical protein
MLAVAIALAARSNRLRPLRLGGSRRDLRAVFAVEREVNALRASPQPRARPVAPTIATRRARLVEHVSGSRPLEAETACLRPMAGTSVSSRALEMRPSRRSPRESAGT